MPNTANDSKTVLVTFSTTVQGDQLAMTSNDAKQHDNADWEVHIGEDQSAVVRINGPSNRRQPSRLNATSTFQGDRPPQTWTSAKDHVQSATLTDGGSYTVELDVTSSGEEPVFLKATPVIIIRKGGLPDPFPPAPAPGETAPDSAGKKLDESV